MNTESQPARHSSLVTGHCSLCDGTGWRPRDPEEPRRGVVRCTHGREPGTGNRESQLEPIGPAVHRLIGSLADAALTPNDRKIRSLLQQHVGKAQAIRAADLAALVFDGAGDPRRKEEDRRHVTQSIERLRTFARLPIAATKEPPYGYFLAETDEEWDDMHERYMRELVRVARLARLFRPQADIVQRLRGQLQLQNSEVSPVPVGTGARSQESG